MRRRFIVLTLLPAGVALAITAAVAAPALAKGATQASITGPGLAHPLTVTAEGEALPGLGDPLSTLAGQTGLFTVLFGSGSGLPDAPSALRTPPAAASLGPKYTVTYTVPGVTQGPGQAIGQIRQSLPPVAKLGAQEAAGVVLGAQDRALPQRVIGVLHRQRRPTRGPPGPPLQVGH